MQKIILALSLIVITSSRLVHPKVRDPIKDKFSINDLLGNYYLFGLYNTQDKEFVC